MKFCLEDETFEIISTDFRGINAAVENKNMLFLISLADQKGYGKKKDSICYSRMESLEDVIIVKSIHSAEADYLFSFNDRADGTIFRYDFATDKVMTMTDVLEGFYNAVEFRNKIFTVFHTSGKILEIDIEKETIEEHILTYSGTILRWLMKGKKIMVIENEKNELERYLDWMVQMGGI